MAVVVKGDVCKIVGIIPSWVRIPLLTTNIKKNCYFI